jgi:hypothetical protein
MTQPSVDIDDLLHGGMRAIASIHELSLEEAYVIAAKLMVVSEPEIDEYTPQTDPNLDEALVNAARAAHDRGLLENESWVNSNDK